MQPLQARKNPLWLYSCAEGTDRVSEDLSLKDLEKLVRRFTSLSKKSEVPSSCRVEPFSGVHALPFVSVFFLRVLLLLLTAIVFSSGLIILSCSLADSACRITKLFLPFLHYLKVEMYPSEPSSLTTRKKLLFARANPQNLIRVRVPLTKSRSKDKLLALLIQTLLLLLLLRIITRGRETLTKKILARLNFLYQPPKNLLPKNKKSSTPSLLLATSARKLFLL